MKKGQAAVEYLSTYGWAIMLLAIVLVVIIGTGVFSPSLFVSEECQLGPGFTCSAQLLSNGKLSMNITNGLGYKIKITKITFYSADTNDLLGEASDMRGELDAGNSMVQRGISLQWKTPLHENSLKKIKVEVKFKNCAREVAIENEECSDTEYLISGRIVTRTLKATP